MSKFNWINGQAGGTPLSAENLNQMQDNLLQLVFPIGSTYITQDKTTNPNSILGFGTWERFKGKIALGVDEEDNDLNTIGETGGEKEHTLTVPEMPSHAHNYYRHHFWNGEQVDFADILGDTSVVRGSGIQIPTSLAGKNQPHNNMQPYEVVGYMWIRRS